MGTAYIELSDQETQALHILAKQTGKTQEELVHDAIKTLLRQTQPPNRLALLQQACGLWQDRTDLPDIGVLRAEFDRFSTGT